MMDASPPSRRCPPIASLLFLRQHQELVVSLRIQSEHTFPFFSQRIREGIAASSIEVVSPFVLHPPFSVRARTSSPRCQDDSSPNQANPFPPLPSAFALAVTRGNKPDYVPSPCEHDAFVSPCLFPPALRPLSFFHSTNDALLFPPLTHWQKQPIWPGRPLRSG